MDTNKPMHVAQLAKDALLNDYTKVNELRDLAVSAVLQLEALKNEVHRLAGTQYAADVKTVITLRDTTRLINQMRYGHD